MAEIIDMMKCFNICGIYIHIGVTHGQFPIEGFSAYGDSCFDCTSMHYLVGCRPSKWGVNMLIMKSILS